MCYLYSTRLLQGLSKCTSYSLSYFHAIRENTDVQVNVSIIRIGSPTYGKAGKLILVALEMEFMKALW